MIKCNLPDSYFISLVSNNIDCINFAEVITEDLLCKCITKNFKVIEVVDSSLVTANVLTVLSSNHYLTKKVINKYKNRFTEDDWKRLVNGNSFLALDCLPQKKLTIELAYSCFVGYLKFFIAADKNRFNRDLSYYQKSFAKRFKKLKLKDNDKEQLLIKLVEDNIRYYLLIDNPSKEVTDVYEKISKLNRL